MFWLGIFLFVFGMAVLFLDSFLQVLIGSFFIFTGLTFIFTKWMAARKNSNMKFGDYEIKINNTRKK